MELVKKIIPECLSNGGRMGELMRSFDWAKTPLGEPEEWSQSLQSMISIMLANRFPMALWWGPHFIQFYNDPFIDIAGFKHPKALGQSGTECWAEIWNVIGPLIETPRNGGPATWMDDIFLEMNRKNFVEETHFTMAFSPVPDNTAENGIGGVLGIANEIGPKIIGERRMILLHDLATKSAEARTVRKACILAAETVSHHPKDIPFALFYLLTSKGNQAYLVATAGLEMDKDSNLVMIDLSGADNETDHWNLFEVLQSENLQVVNDLKNRFKKVPQGPWADAPRSAAIIPVRSNKAHDFVGFIICGISSRLPFDSQYENFFELLSSQVSTAIATASVIEEEHKRAEALIEIDKEKTVFFNNASHEFRTPLTLMLGPLEELMKQGPNEISAQNLSSIETTHRNAMRLLKLVNNLLDFSLIESGRQQASFSLVDINTFTKNLASNFRSVIEKAGLQLIVHVQAIQQPVYVDTQMWEKIVFNLLSNAFKYTLSGSISVSLLAENDHVILEITDTGVGIPEKELPHMFKRFHRVQGMAGRTYEGTGIGLSMIKELIQLHGGTIGIASKEGEGSTFKVTIPTGKEHLPAKQVSAKEKNIEDAMPTIYVEEATTLIESVAKINKIESPSENGKDTAKTATVLIVDDNADMREYLTSLLKKNYHIVTANNGKEALNKINEQHPNIVLSDIMMPVMDGIQLLKEVKLNPKTVHIPVILLSARAGEESKIEGYDIGADDYLIKPFSAKELLARVRSQLKLTALRHHTEQQLSNFFIQAPLALCILRGENFVIEAISERMVEMWDRKMVAVLNRPAFDVLPELRDQGFKELLDSVYSTGERFVADELPINLMRNGKLENAFIKFVYEPLREEDGTISGVMAFALEITQEVIAKNKNQENQQMREKELEEKVLQRTLELNEANEALQQKNQEVALSKYNKRFLSEFSEKFSGYTVQSDFFNSLVQFISDTTNLDFVFVGKLMQNDKDEFSIQTIALTAFGKLTENINYTLPDGPCEQVINRVFYSFPKHCMRIFPKNKTIELFGVEGYLGYPLHDEKGNAMGLIAVMHQKEIEDDETVSSILKIVARRAEIEMERLKNGEQLVENNIELGEKNKELEKMNRELEAFNYIASHDLQEPLRKIQTFAGLVLQHEVATLSDKAKGYFLKMQDSALRMQRLIKDLLSYSQATKSEKNFEKTDLNKLVEDLIRDFRELTHAKNATFTVSALCQPRIIPFQFRQLIHNLISNSLKFISPERPPHIIIKSETALGSKFQNIELVPEKKYCYISFSDNGIGFNPEYKNKIFELFQYLNPKDQYPGTGIGLAIVKKIIENHNGMISVTSEINKGTTFGIYIPED